MNKEIFDKLNNDGIYQGSIDKQIIEYWNKVYFTDIDNNSYLLKEYNQKFRKVNLLDNFIEQVFEDKILSTISLIYQKQAKIRDIFAVLTLSKEEGQTYTGHAAKWHTDLKNSFALMILLNDISINDTHMEFVTGEQKENKKIFSDLDFSHEKIKHCIGDAGTFFLFNNGNYIHRQNLLAKKPRKTMHCIYLPEDDSYFQNH